MKHQSTLSCWAASRIVWLCLLLALPLAGHTYPVNTSDGWALTAPGGLVSCLNNASCYGAQTEIPVTTPRTVKFTGQYQGTTLSLNGANGYVYIANHGGGSVTYTTRVTNLSTGALLASGVTTTTYVQGTTTCADRGQSPSTNAQPLLLVPSTGALLASGSTVEISISMSSAQPINLGVCVGMAGSSYTTSTLNLAGTMVPNFDAPTPACGSFPFPDASGTYSFQVVGSHPSASSGVSLDVAGLPAGATLTPPLPLRGNPASTRFSWKPAPTQAGSFDLTFTVSDEGVTTKTCTFKFDFGPRKTPRQIKESLLVSPPDFPQKVTVETVCRESVADVCLSRDIVEICVGGKCFGLPQQEPPPCKVCELERRLRR